MFEPLECEGAPRDLGLDQGRACGADLRTRLAMRPWWERLALTLGGGDAELERACRDLRRHFPHQWESFCGLSVGAKVPLRWLVRQLLREFGGNPALAPLAAGVVGPSTLLARGLAGVWRTRCSRPEGLFASVEITRPWLPAALAGVNERGLAGVVLPGASPMGACAAPAAGLLQDCLERFEGLEAALEWCLNRPAGAGATLLLADARGELAGVEISSAARRVLRPAGGLLVAGGSPDRCRALGKRAAESGALDAEGLGRAVADAAGVILDPRARHLEIEGRRLSL